MILVNYELPDTKAPDLLRELLTDERYLSIPKLVWGPDGRKREMDECLVLGVKKYLQKPDDSIALGDIVRQIDSIMKAELQIA
jgi:DNA-binding NarL/FixJ family response regulator